MRLFPVDKPEDPCGDDVVVDHCDGMGSTLLPCEMMAGSVHGTFIHRSLDPGGSERNDECRRSLAINLSRTRIVRGIGLIHDLRILCRR